FNRSITWLRVLVCSVTACQITTNKTASRVTPVTPISRQVFQFFMSFVGDIYGCDGLAMNSLVLIRRLNGCLFCLITDAAGSWGLLVLDSWRESSHMASVTLDDLDRLLARRKQDADLDGRLKEALDVEEFLQLAASQGLDVTESDLFAAQQRDEIALSAKDLQQRMADEARRLRHFIQG
ncbi:MAG: Nif11-like leader peptide family natural product precursor, partial [Prochlorococcus sp.]